MTLKLMARLFPRVNDPHAVYEEAFEHLQINNAPPLLISSRLKNFSSPHYFGRVLLSLSGAFFLVVDIYRARPWQNVVLVREFWSLPLLLVAIFIWPVSRHVLFNINHNLVGAGSKAPLAIRVLARCGFSFVLFDGASTVDKFGSRYTKTFHTPLFPSVTLPETRVSASKPYKIGIVGSNVSIEASSNKFFEELDYISRDSRFKLLYGFRNYVPEAISKLDDIELIDTHSRESFKKYLSSLDFVVFVAQHETYYYRHSGTVMDAIANGVIPIVPEFPILKSQVSCPCHVGKTYNTQAGLAHAVESALQNRDTLVANQLSWHEARKLSTVLTNG